MGVLTAVICRSGFCIVGPCQLLLSKESMSG